MASSADRGERIALAVPPLDATARRRAEDRGWNLRLLDPEDIEERSLLIRLAHPELDEAIAQNREEVGVGGETMNPRLHLSIHEVVAAQIIGDDPPEAFATAKRLVELRRDRHEVLHMLGSTVAEQIWSATQSQGRYDPEAHVRALASLPDSWDRQIRGTDPHRRAGRTGRQRRRRRS
ncbi:MAG: DUF1841 family protein [Solirubrobacterales bacterium]